MPLYKLMNEMSYEELLGWLAYFERRPVGWRDDDRSFKFIQTQGFKGKPWTLFPSLDAIYNPPKPPEDEKKLDLAKFKKSALFSKILGAKGGETVFK